MMRINLWGPTTNTWFTTSGAIAGPYNLPVGTSVTGAATAFFRPGGSTDLASQLNLNSSNNYLGFRFTNEAAGGAINFGWLQLQVGATAAVRSIIAYAYEDSGAAIPVGTTPVSLQNFSVD